MSDSEDPIDPIEPVDEDDGDLFGDDGDEVAASPNARTLDDEDLASDRGAEDDGDARHTQDDRGQSPVEQQEYNVMDVKAFRHANPKPSDNTLRVLRIPKFLKVEPNVYDPDSFQPSEFDVENATADQPKHVARYQKDPETGELKSNANVYRWSDGSVTVSVGGEHYEITRKALAPPAGQPYNELQDGHYYAMAAEVEANMFFTVGHIMEQYTVRPNKEIGDDALERLAAQMQQASKEGRSENMIIRTTKDPELQKKQAEMAEKEREKAKRRRENAAAKADGTLGRPSRGGGLSIGDLEGGRRSGGRKRGFGEGKPKRRRPEYDSDDDLPQGVGRHEDYEDDGGFVVNSDEEIESEVEQDDEEILEDDDDDRPHRKRQRPVDEDESEGEAEATHRSRRRNVIDDDDE